jgi:hypothetical protein
MEYYSAIKKNDIMSLAGKQMKLGIVMFSEISQAQKPKYHMHHSFVEPRPRTMMMVMIMKIRRHECERGCGERILRSL